MKKVNFTLNILKQFELKQQWSPHWSSTILSMKGFFLGLLSPSVWFSDFDFVMLLMKPITLPLTPLLGSSLSYAVLVSPFSAEIKYFGHHELYGLTTGCSKTVANLQLNITLRGLWGHPLCKVSQPNPKSKKIYENVDF